MGFIDFIFGKTVIINDPFFGEMKFMEFRRNPENNYFECRRHFEPTGDVIEIGIKADAIGPAESQKEFFRSIESNYSEVISSIIPLIEAEFNNWQDGFQVKEFFNEFKADYLLIPRCENSSEESEIVFESIHDPHHFVTMTMKGFKAQEILIDG